MNEIIMVIGRFGQSCACAGEKSAMPSAANMIFRIRLSSLIDCYSAVTPAFLIGTAHFSISASTNFCR